MKNLDILSFCNSDCIKYSKLMDVADKLVEKVTDVLVGLRHSIYFYLGIPSIKLYYFKFDDFLVKIMYHIDL